jgi:hypothetical protein
MSSLSPRENLLRALRHEETEYMPMCFPVGDAAMAGTLPPADYGNENTGFRDGFGVRWVASVLSYSNSKRYGFVNSLNCKELTKQCISPFV